MPVFDSCGRGLYSALGGSQNKPRGKWYPGVLLGTWVEWKLRSSDNVLRNTYLPEFDRYAPGSSTKVDSYLEGVFSSGYGSPIRDSLYLQFPVTGYGFATGFARLPGNIDASTSGGFVGSTTAVQGVASTRRVVPERDTVSYTYQWKLDNVNIPGADDAEYTGTFSTASVGSHDLSVVVYKSDFSSYTVLRSI